VAERSGGMPVACRLNGIWALMVASCAAISLAHAEHLSLPRLWSASGYDSDLWKQHYTLFSWLYFSNGRAGCRSSVCPSVTGVLWLNGARYDHVRCLLYYSVHCSFRDSVNIACMKLCNLWQIAFSQWLEVGSWASDVGGTVGFS